jgi:hypothetical protein
VPWCAIFASYAYDVGAGVVLCRGWSGAGVAPRGVAYVPTLAAWLKATGRVIDDPRPGDLVVFDWDGGEPDHVGLVVRPTAEGVDTVEGNTGLGNDADGGEVMRRARPLEHVALFGRLT